MIKTEDYKKRPLTLDQLLEIANQRNGAFFYSTNLKKRFYIKPLNVDQEEA